MNDYGMSGFSFGMGFGWLVPILLILVLFYFLNLNKDSEVSARDILDKKYASGEITKEEYKIKRANLE